MFTAGGENARINPGHLRHIKLLSRSAFQKMGFFGNVLKIGCGSAVWTKLYIKHINPLFLIAISEEMVKSARERIMEWEGGRYNEKVTYTCGDFVSVPIMKERFDTIISVRAFEYTREKGGVLKKCYDLLEEEGRLVVVTKNKNWMDLRLELRKWKKAPCENLPSSISVQKDLVTAHELASLFERANFTEVASFPVVFAAYHRPFTWNWGLALSDIIHRTSYKQEFRERLTFLIESFLTIGQK